MSARHKRCLFAATLVMAAACSAKPPAARQPHIPVEVAFVSQISAPVEIAAVGVVEPMQTVAVEAQVGGTLTDVAFKEGDQVTVGQVLFRLDPRPFEAAVRQAQGMLARDAAQAANARRDADRYQQLAQKDYVTKSQADQAESQAASPGARLAADSPAVESARLNLAYATITALIAGRTGSLLVRQGNLVKPGGSPMVVINQIQPILVRFPVAEHDFAALQARMHRGAPDVRAIAADSTPIPENGALSFIDNAVDSMTSTVMAKAEFANSSGALWPGEYVRAVVRLDVQPNVIAVPTPAVQSGQEGNYVFVVGKDSTVKMRPVTAGRAVGAMTIVEMGLVVGEQVVTDGQSRLTPGARVDIKGQPKAATAARGASSAGAAGAGGPAGRASGGNP